MARHLTREQRHEIVQLQASGAVKADLARRFGVSWETIDYTCRKAKNSPQRKRPRTPLSVDDVEEIKVLWQAGHSREDIAHRFDTSVQTTRQVTLGRVPGKAPSKTPMEIRATHRRCVDCEVDKPLADFAKTRPICKKCVLRRTNAARTPESNRRATFKWKYGITVDSYQRMYEAQGGTCPICDKRFDKLCVDHSHKSGLVRNLLCNGCNTAIGHLKEDPATIVRAAKYVDYWSHFLPAPLFFNPEKFGKK